MDFSISEIFSPFYIYFVKDLPKLFLVTFYKFPSFVKDFSTFILKAILLFCNLLKALYIIYNLIYIPSYFYRIFFFNGVFQVYLSMIHPLFLQLINGFFKRFFFRFIYQGFILFFFLQLINGFFYKNFPTFKGFFFTSLF